MGNIVKTISKISCKDEDVIILLDGDDWLASSYSLDILANRYQEDDCLMTYGSYVYNPGGMKGVEPSAYPKEIIEQNLFREDVWRASHLRSFKYNLWLQLDHNDLRDEEGHFYKMAYDQAIMLPLLELAGYRSSFIEDVLHVYNKENPLNVDKIKAQEQYQTARKIRNKKKYKLTNVLELETKRYYDSLEENTDYQEIQIKRHNSKSHIRRDFSKYKQVFDNSLSYLNEDMKEGICLGTRNEHEKECFQKLFDQNDLNLKVFSLDIAEESKSDYTMDFNTLPVDWENKWDFIYSNSIDHAISATKVYNEWYRTLKPGGVMVIGFDMYGHDNPDSEPFEADCCLFNHQDIDFYFENQAFDVKEKFFVEHIPGANFYFVVVKK